ncbi:MAG TPA: hypothetical protein VMU88_05970, partial [bacterium]|nr:hypothetical protein [bacterium]
LQKDLRKTLVLAEEVNAEKKRLEEKAEILRLKPPEAKRAEPASRPEVLDRSPLQDADLIRQVYRLADAEVDLDGISKKTQLTQGEIQLILNLRGNRFSTPN